MNFIENTKEIIEMEKIDEESIDFLEDIVNAILGNPIAIGKIIFTLAKSPFFMREKIFWNKLQLFLNGVYLDDKDCEKLRARLMENEENKDNVLRLVDCIDNIQTQRKMNYLINATRCLLSEFIDRATYFRICHIITHTLDEDLLFLRKNIKGTDFLYSSNVQGLLVSGLMFQSVFDANDEQKYSFTPLAQIIDQYSISYDDVERYPNPLQPCPITPNPQPQIFDAENVTEF